MNLKSADNKPGRKVLAATSIGCGIDVVELPRFRRVLSRGGRNFLDRIFTPHEQAYAKERKRTEILHLAGRFAAKEAILKAIAQLKPHSRFAMKNIEIYNDKQGRPHAHLHGRSAKGLAIHVSLSHVASVAVANAIAIKASTRT
ncbi:MAG: holo-ACP synthase [Candidatus Omnitrophica bacterium]|nr:holo-ACP synthase [Candidatus Omnitrophota bacterium]